MRQNSHLDKVIECLQEHEKTLPSKPAAGEDITTIHHFTIDLLDKFGEHVDRCKKYNEARIHRKYENTLSFLQEENERLKAKLAMQREAQPASQKYVSDLIDRMVELRAINEQLMRDNESLRAQASYRKESSDPSRGGSLDQSSEGRVVRETVMKFTRVRKQQRLKQPRQVTNFEKFLEFNSSKASKWTLLQLFQRLQKWIANLKDVRFLDSERIRHNFDRSYTSISQSHPLHNLRKTQDDPSIYSSKLRTEAMSQPTHQQFTILRRKRRPGPSLLRNTLRSQKTISH